MSTTTARLIRTIRRLTAKHGRFPTPNEIGSVVGMRSIEVSNWLGYLVRRGDIVRFNLPGDTSGNRQRYRYELAHECAASKESNRDAVP